MVNQHDPPLDQFDLFKRKHLRQNRDIIRANSTQAMRIRTLESDVRRLMDENLSLRTELIQTKCQLARQSNSSALVESARNAQRALEKVLLDVAGIKNGIQDSLQSVRSGNPDLSNVSSRGIKKTVKERRRMDLKFDEFNEERKNKQKALTSGLEAPFSGSPRVTSETDASDSETEDILTDDINVSDFSRSTNPAIPIHKDNPPTPTITTLKRSTLKNPIREKPQIPTTTTTTTTTPPPPLKEPSRKRRRSEMFSTVPQSIGKENISILPPGSDLFSPPSRTNDKAQQRGVLVESSPPRPSLIIPAGLTRLESPNKPMQMQARVGEKGGKDYERGKDFGDGVFGLDGGFFEEGGGRRTSRARKVVNYALPNLRDKMRREENSEDKPRGRSRSVDRSVTPDQMITLENFSTRPPVKGVIVKQEPSTTPPSPVRSTPITIKSSSSQPTSQPDKSAKPRLSLIERQSLHNMSRPSETTTKKRRTSNLHEPLPKPASQPLKTPDIFRFPSESPPKQPAKPVPPPASKSTASSGRSEDKENTMPGWPRSITGRERRRTFNVTMEKLARMTQEEMQADTDWEANLSKRRRQSVAI